MKKSLFLTVAIGLLATLYVSNHVMAAYSEEDAVRKPLLSYLKGHETGRAEHMKAAFYEEGHLMFIRDGKYTARTFKDYIAGMSGKAAADEADRKRHIESIDIAGDAAVGKIVLDYPNAKFVDYMTLLKIDGEWKIVNKAFYVERKEK